MKNNQKQSLELHTTTPDHGTICLIMAENDRVLTLSSLNEKWLSRY